MHLFTIIAAIVILASSTSLQQPQARRNAAVDYWRAGYLQAMHGRTESGETPLRDLDFAALGSNLDPARMPPEFHAARTAVSAAAISDYIRASTAEQCDFQLDLSQGPYLLMPHLTLLRDVARAARVDARAKLMEGKPDEAAERIAAMFRSAGHVAQDGVLINSLVGVAIAVQASQEAKVFAQSGKSTGESRQAILAAIRSLGPRDPFNMVGALEGERKMFIPWLRREYAGPDGSARFAGFIAETKGLDPENPDHLQLVEQLGSLTEKELRRQFDLLEAFYADLIPLWNAEDYDAAAKKLENDAKAGKYGHSGLIRELAPSLHSARQSEQRGREALREAEEALKARP